MVYVLKSNKYWWDLRNRKLVYGAGFCAAKFNQIVEKTVFKSIIKSRLHQWIEAQTFQSSISLSIQQQLKINIDISHLINDHNIF